MVFKLQNAPLEGESASKFENPSVEAYPADRHPRNAHKTNPYVAREVMKPIVEEGDNLDEIEMNEREETTPRIKVKEKIKVKKPIKLEPPPIVQASKEYSIVSDLLNTKANITFAQLMQAAPIRKELKRSMTPRRKSTKQAHFSLPASLSKGSTFTPLSCKAMVCGWTIDLIIDSGSSISVISKKFLEDIG